MSTAFWFEAGIAGKRPGLPTKPATGGNFSRLVQRSQQGLRLGKVLFGAGGEVVHLAVPEDIPQGHGIMMAGAWQVFTQAVFLSGSRHAAGFHAGTG
jgi:hypothetical protein